MSALGKMVQFISNNKLKHLWSCIFLIENYFSARLSQKYLKRKNHDEKHDGPIRNSGPTDRSSDQLWDTGPECNYEGLLINGLISVFFRNCQKMIKLFLTKDFLGIIRDYSDSTFKPKIFLSFL